MEDLFRIELSYKDHYSYGIYHCGFPLFEYLRLSNLSENSFENLNIEVQTTPDILLNGKCVVNFLAPLGSHFLSLDFLKIDSTRIAQLSSILDVTISVTVFDDEGTVLKNSDFSCKILPFYYFSGLGNMPETLSFFVTPSQPELEEFQVYYSYSDPLDFCHHLYDQIKEKQLTFASEDYTGSFPLPVRLPEKVLRERVANSLEFCLLFASCCEKVGLWPVLGFCGKGKVYVGFSLKEHSGQILSSYGRNQKNVDEYSFLDGNYFAYGSELSFDAALFHSKNSLTFSDDRMILLDIKSARKSRLISLPNRVFERGNLVLSTQSVEEKSGKFDDYYSLLNEFSDNEKILGILTGKKFSVSGQKNVFPFQIGLDVNQNKIFGKILSNDLTLIRAQMGSGVSTLFAQAAMEVLKRGKNVLYIKDPQYHSQNFSCLASRLFDTGFIYDMDKETTFDADAFKGFFSVDSRHYDEKVKAEESLRLCDQYYANLEGDKQFVSSFLFASDRYHNLRDANEAVVFSPEQVGKLSDEEVQTWFTTVNDLVKSFTEIEDVAENPLRLIRHRQFSYEYKSKLIMQLESFLRSVETIIQVRDQLVGSFPSLDGIRSAGVFYAFQELIRLFSEFRRIPEQFFDRSDLIESNYRKAMQLIQAKKENDSILETVLISFQGAIFELDAEDLYLRYQSLQNDKSFKAISQKHSILKNIKRHLKPNCDVENVEYILSRLFTYRKNLDFMEREREDLFRLFSVPFDDAKEAWDSLQFAADLCYQSYSVFLGYFSIEKLPQFVSDYRIASASNGVVDKLNYLRELGEEFTSLKEELEISLENQIDFHYPQASARDHDYFSFLYQELTRVFESADHLKEWCTWLSIREKAIEIGLKNFVISIENGKVLPTECKRSFLRAFFKGICEYNFILHPELVPGNFQFDEKFQQYEEYCRFAEIASREENNFILSQRRMRAFLQLQDKKFVPKELLAKSPETFFDIFPCVVSTVEDAKKHFSSHKGMFDLILIESRNSIKILDFLWTLSCGKKVAFAGSYILSYHEDETIFDLSHSAFDYLWKITDEKYSLNAIYEGKTNLSLLRCGFGDALRSDWHGYAVPAVHYEPVAKHVRVSGSFDVEVPSANPAEAEYCAERLIRFAKENDSQSVGIIAATHAQKQLILRLLSQKLRQNDELSDYFSEYKRFYISSVKEEMVLCDHIIFSLTYSPDKSLHGSRIPYSFLQFGGLDPQKLFFQLLSSARESFQLVTSFDADELKFSPSALPSVSALRLFFRMFEERRFNRGFTLSGLHNNSNVLSSLKLALEERGYRVFSGVQSGRYYIDLAIYDEEYNFLLGILSDQTVMNQKSNVSSIEFSNFSFYQKCGWKLYRLRSTNCFDSFERELESILNLLSPKPTNGFMM